MFQNCRLYLSTTTATAAVICAFFFRAGSAPRQQNDDIELVANPPTPFQIVGKHPPAPKKSGRPATSKGRKVEGTAPRQQQHSSTAGQFLCNTFQSNQSGNSLFSWLSAKIIRARAITNRRVFASKNAKNRFKWRSIIAARAAQKPGFCGAKPRFLRSRCHQHFFRADARKLIRFLGLAYISSDERKISKSRNKLATKTLTCDTDQTKARIPKWRPPFGCSRRALPGPNKKSVATKVCGFRFS